MELFLFTCICYYFTVQIDLSGARTVKSGLHERRPRVLEEKTPADVVLTNPCHSGVDGLATVVLYCVFPEEEEGEEADVVGRDEMWL